MLQKTDLLCFRSRGRQQSDNGNYSMATKTRSSACWYVTLKHISVGLYQAVQLAFLLMQHGIKLPILWNKNTIKDSVTLKLNYIVLISLTWTKRTGLCSVISKALIFILMKKWTFLLPFICWRRYCGLILIKIQIILFVIIVGVFGTFYDVTVSFSWKNKNQHSYFLTTPHRISQPLSLKIIYCSSALMPQVLHLQLLDVCRL